MSGTGLVGTGMEFKRQGQMALQDFGRIRDQRVADNRALKAADQAGDIGLAASGAGLGAALAGAEAGGIAGPWGAAIGLGLGLVGGALT